MILNMIIVFFVSILWIYDIARKKYEVFGIIIDSSNGAKGVDFKYFRTRKSALKCYNDYRSKYIDVMMYEL